MSERFPTETVLTPKELGEQYWREQIEVFGGDPENQNYKEKRSLMLEELRKNTGEGNDTYDRTSLFIDGKYSRQHNEASEEDLKRIAGTRLLAGENGLEVGPYAFYLKSDTARARVTDIRHLEALKAESFKKGEGKLPLEKASLLELRNLCDRALEAQVGAANLDSNFEEVSRLATELQAKFPHTRLDTAIIEKSGNTNVSKAKQGGEPVIIAPEGTARLYKMKLYVDRLRQRLASNSQVELKASAVAPTIDKLMNFIHDTERSLYPKGYYLL